MFQLHEIIRLIEKFYQRRHRRYNYYWHATLEERKLPILLMMMYISSMVGRLVTRVNCDQTAGRIEICPANDDINGIDCGLDQGYVTLDERLVLSKLVILFCFLSIFASLDEVETIEDIYPNDFDVILYSSPSCVGI